MKSVVGRRSSARLPSKIDVSGNDSPIENQFDLGSCVNNSLVGAMEHLYRRSGMPTHVDLSRLFVYYEARRLEGSIQVDAGIMIRTGMIPMIKTLK